MNKNPLLPADPEEDSEATPESPTEEAQELLKKIQTREKYFDSVWWSGAKDVVKIYNQEEADPQNVFNILYSNVQVLKPSLYSATPKPDVRGRFIDSSVPLPVTKLIENMLIVFSDPSSPGVESLDDAMDQLVLNALVPGAGFIRLRYYPNRPVPICPESGSYQDLIWGPGRKWAQVSWIAFRHELTPDSFFTQFEVAEENQSKLSVSAEDDDAEEKDPDQKSPTAIVVYEFWDKTTKKVSFLCENWDEILIREDSDPFGLVGFFPTPGPLVLTAKPGRLMPTPMYSYYQNQAEELNRVTVRLNRVLSAIKVRGAYNSLLGDEMAAILNSDDSENRLVEAPEASAMLSQTGGFDKHIWLIPIEQLVKVAAELYKSREVIKQTIYEITGISDIIRGSSVASETATAQNLKNKWGSIRLRDMQKLVAGYVRDLYRLCLDAATLKLSPQQWKIITNTEIPLQVEIDAAKQQLQMSSLAPGGPPPDPKLIQKTQSPSLESVLEKGKNDNLRSYTVNVQSDSTIDLDTATDKAEVAEFMNAFGQMMAGLQPLAQLGPPGLEVAKQVVLATCQRFKFGLGIADSVRGLQMPPPQQNGPTPEQQQKGKDLQKQTDDLKTYLTKIQDAQRQLETSRKEFEADVKVVRAEQEAQQKIAAANQQAQQHAAAAEQAKQESTFVQKKSELTSLSAQQKAQQRVAQKTTSDIQPMMQAMAEAVQSLQKAMQAMSQPRSVKKGPDGSWTSTPIETPPQ